jgi:hypothetical protein
MIINTASGNEKNGNSLSTWADSSAMSKWWAVEDRNRRRGRWNVWRDTESASVEVARRATAKRRDSAGRWKAGDPQTLAEVPKRVGGTKITVRLGFR